MKPNKEIQFLIQLHFFLSIMIQRTTATKHGIFLKNLTIQTTIIH